MTRVPMPFLVLVVMGGCMAVEPDPIYDAPYGPAPRSLAQAQTWSYGTPQRMAAQPQAWSYLPQSTKTVAKKTTDKSQNKVVKASYTETKPPEEESPPVSLGMLRLTNSKRITFHYKINDVASTGSADLEIWGTTDMQSWKKYEAAARLPSSLAVEVKDEGLYGFTMIARSKDESANTQPPAGMPPQVWVAVDLTNPVVQLFDAEVNVQAQTPSLVVRWNAKDRNFGPRPITLMYAEHPEGPWRPIAANLENSGRYEGCLPPHLADIVYVRVQAVDLMGNIGTSQTTLRIPSKSASSAAPVSHPTVSILSVDGE